MSAPEVQKGRLADLPLDERRTLDEAKQRELEDGFTRRHVQNAREREATAAANLARALKHGGG